MRLPVGTNDLPRPQREYYLPEWRLNFGEGKKNVLMMCLRPTEKGTALRAAEVAPHYAKRRRAHRRSEYRPCGRLPAPPEVLFGITLRHPQQTEGRGLETLPPSILAQIPNAIRAANLLLLLICSRVT
jgi:hypothetical protein